jgi:hypothetical protein
VPDDLGTLRRDYGNLPPLPHDFGQQPPGVPAPDPPRSPNEPPPWASLPEPEDDGPAPPPTINPNWLKRLRREE